MEWQRQKEVSNNLVFAVEVLTAFVTGAESRRSMESRRSLKAGGGAPG